MILYYSINISFISPWRIIEYYTNKRLTTAQEEIQFKSVIRIQLCKITYFSQATYRKCFYHRSGFKTASRNNSRN